MLKLICGTANEVKALLVLFRKIMLFSAEIGRRWSCLARLPQAPLLLGVTAATSCWDRNPPSILIAKSSCNLNKGIFV